MRNAPRRAVIAGVVTAAASRALAKAPGPVALTAPPVPQPTPEPEFDPKAYLDGMRALGSRFYATIDSSTGKVKGLGESFPIDGWTEGQTDRMLELMGPYRACPDGARRVCDVLVQEGNVLFV